MPTQRSKKKFDEFSEIMTVPIRDIQFLMHQIINTMRKINRDGKIEDYVFAFLHKDIDLVFKETLLPVKSKKK